MKKLVVAVFGLPLWFASVHAAEDILLSQTRIQLGNKELFVDIADTQEKQSQGLMHRSSLSENEGMLFVFSDSKPRTFWMKNTFIPLSVGIFDDDHRLLEILDLEPATSVMQRQYPVTTSQHSARYALEVRQGWFAHNQITIGTIFNFLGD